jgi:hypothetical protein
MAAKITVTVSPRSPAAAGVTTEPSGTQTGPRSSVGPRPSLPCVPIGESPQRFVAIGKSLRHNFQCVADHDRFLRTTCAFGPIESSSLPPSGGHGGSRPPDIQNPPLGSGTGSVPRSACSKRRSPRSTTINRCTLAEVPWAGLHLEESRLSGIGESGNDVRKRGRDSRPSQPADLGLACVWDERLSTFDVSQHVYACDSTQLTATGRRSRRLPTPGRPLTIDCPGGAREVLA